jgi:spermidine synthase
VAKQVFGFREDAAMRAYVKDGRRLIEECREPYDIIFLDAFGSDNIPYALSTREFLLAVRRALRPKGIAVGNIWSRASNSLYDSMVRTYLDVFDALYIVEVQGVGNRILIALPRAERIDRDELARRAKRISQERRFPFDMGEVVAYGFTRAEKDASRGRILLDKDKPTD